MTNTARHLTTGLAVAFVLANAAQAIAAEDERLRIVLHVDDYARISPADHSAAQVEVTRIYASAGVNTVWATTDDHADAAGLHVRVQLLSRAMAMRRITAGRVADSVVGLAAREARRVSIFTHRIVNLAAHHREDFGRVLGRALAHEVGHLVLPTYSHSDRGIMRAQTSVRSNGSYEFTTAQGVAIRAMLVAASRPHSSESTESPSGVVESDPEASPTNEDGHP